MAWKDLQDTYVRVSIKLPCPICTKSDGCLVAKDKSHVICYHVQSKVLWSNGFYHELKDKDFEMVIPTTTQHSVHDFISLHNLYVKNITGPLLSKLSDTLHIRMKTLTRMCVGYKGSPTPGGSCYTIPVRDEHFKIVGIQQRYMNGMKRLMPDSKAGLFIPNGWHDKPGVTFVTEGASDLGTALDLGLNAIGRYNNMSNVEQLRVLLKDHIVFIVADNNGPEKCGAAQLKQQLNACDIVAEIIHIPSGNPRFKDLREFKHQVGARKCLTEIFRQCRTF